MRMLSTLSFLLVRVVIFFIFYIGCDVIVRLVLYYLKVKILCLSLYISYYDVNGLDKGFNQS